MNKAVDKLIRPMLRRAVRSLQRTRSDICRFPYQITLTDLSSGGCRFEVTTPVEESRVVTLGAEEDSLRRFWAEVRPGDVVYDIGSCVGLYALHAALRGAKVVAFEPDPSYRQRLVRNISINKLEASIRVIDWAVSDRRGEAFLYTDGIEGNSPSLAQVGKRDAVVVRTDSIDNAISEDGLWVPSLLKLDIEGAELLALRGMNRLLGSKAAPRRLFVELHPDFLSGFGSSAEECTTLIESYGYRIEHRVPRAAQVHCIYVANARS